MFLSNLSEHDHITNFLFTLYPIGIAVVSEKVGKNNEILYSDNIRWTRTWTKGFMLLSNLPHWEDYISLSFQIEWDMIVVTVFLSILNQIDFPLAKNRKENCHHDHIPFNVKGKGNIVFSGLPRGIWSMCLQIIEPYVSSRIKWNKLIALTFSEWFDTKRIKWNKPIAGLTFSKWFNIKRSYVYFQMNRKIAIKIRLCSG